MPKIWKSWWAIPEKNTELKDGQTDWLRDEQTYNGDFTGPYLGRGSNMSDFYLNDCTYQTISSQYSLLIPNIPFIPPPPTKALENLFDVFWCFLGGQKEMLESKWILIDTRALILVSSFYFNKAQPCWIFIHD